MDDKLEKIYNEIFQESEKSVDSGSEDSQDGSIGQESPAKHFRMKDSAYEQMQDEDDDQEAQPEDKGEGEGEGKGVAEPETPEDEQESPADTTEKETTDSDEYIDDRLVRAARRAGLSDAAIVELDANHPEALEAIAKAQEQAEKLLGQSGAAAAVQQEQSEQNKSDALTNLLKDLDIDSDEFDDLSPKMKTAIKAIAAQVQQLSDAVQKHEEHFGAVQKQAEAQAVRFIDDFFDKQAEAIPLLGKSSNLTPQQAEARVFAFKIARGAQLAMPNLTDEQALAIGVNALKGQLKDTEIKSKIVADLERNKKRFIPRPKSRPMHDGSKSVKDRAMETIEAILNDPKYTL